MKKILTLIAIFLLPLATFAQDMSAGPKYVPNAYGQMPSGYCEFGPCPEPFKNYIFKGLAIIWIFSFVYIIYCLNRYFLRKKVSKIRFIISIIFFCLGLLFLAINIFNYLNFKNNADPYYEIYEPTPYCVPGEGVHC